MLGLGLFEIRPEDRLVMGVLLSLAVFLLVSGLVIYVYCEFVAGKSQIGLDDNVWVQGTGTEVRDGDQD